MASKMASCNDVFAEPMLDDDENFLEDYCNDLTKLQEEGILPTDLKKEMTYNVYSLEGSGCGAHRSIVLSSDDKRFFSIELGFIDTKDGKRRIYPVTEKIDARLKKKFESHGKVSMSTATLLSQGVAVMKKFGNYFKFCNNCQDYCNYYLEAIGLGDKKKMTDVEKTALFSIAAALLAILLMLVLKK